MELGFVGLGRMGMSMTRRLVGDGHRVVAYDRSADTVQEAQRHGAAGAASPAALVASLARPRAVWVMVPAGPPTAGVIETLARHLERDDVVLDGGNTHFRDDPRRAETLGALGIHYLDVGTSGGIWGLEEGYCLMVGGDQAVFRRLEPVFRTLAPEGGYGHVGPHGAGHYVKMVHNGIEYGLMQAYAEGFDLMHRSPFDLDLASVARLWLRGSVVRSWLLELTATALAEDPELEKLRGYVDDSGEGRWTVEDAIQREAPAWTIAASLFARFRSREADPFADRLLAALREQFGGHTPRSRD